MKRNKAKNSSILTATILTLSIIALSGSAASITSDANETTDVNVTITSEVAIDVEPNVLQYSSIDVGTQQTVTDRNFGGVTIENTGSEYIDKVWVNASVPQSRPFGTGRPTNYDAGNFLQIRPRMNTTGVAGSSVGEYHFVNRREFGMPEGSVPTYIVAPASEVSFDSGATVSSTGGDVVVGRFRRGQEHIWFIIASPDGSTCDNSGNPTPGPMIRVGDTSSTPNRLGTVDFTDDNSGEWTEYQIAENSASTTYGIANSAVTLQWSNPNEDPRYDVLTTCDTTDENSNVVRTRYAIDYDGTTDLVTNGYQSEYVIDAGVTAGNMLLPGGTVPLQTAIEVPTGVAEGQVELGTLNLVATANTTAQT